MSEGKLSTLRFHHNEREREVQLIENPSSTSEALMAILIFYATCDHYGAYKETKATCIFQRRDVRLKDPMLIGEQIHWQITVDNISATLKLLAVSLSPR